MRELQRQLLFTERDCLNARKLVESSRLNSDVHRPHTACFSIYVLLLFHRSLTARDLASGTEYSRRNGWT